MRLRPTKSTMAILAGALGLVVLAIGSFLWFLNGQLSDRSTELQKKEAELADGQRIARRREQAQADLDRDRQQILFLESSVSDAAYVPTMLKQVEDLAVSTKNRVLAVRPQVVAEAPPTKLQQRRDPNAQDKPSGDAPKDGDKKEEKKAPEPYTRLGINLSVVGSFRSTQMFIEKLNRFPKIVSVDEIQLHPHGAKEGEDASLLDVELKLTAFVMKEPAPAIQRASAPVTASADVKGITQ